jgi:O-Antigen ligase
MSLGAPFTHQAPPPPPPPPRARRRAPDRRNRSALEVALDRAAAAPSTLTIVLAILSAAWSIATIYVRFKGGTLPGPGKVTKLVPYAMPAVLALSLLIKKDRPVSWLDQVCWVWTALVLLAVLLVPSVGRGSTTDLIAILAGGVAAAVARRWPSFALFVVALMSASYGSLDAIWNFPSSKLMALALAGLWVSLIAQVILDGSRPVRLSVGLWLFIAYLAITAIMVPLAPDRFVADYSFKNVDWYFMVVPLLAWSGWQRSTHDRMAKTLLLVALAAGGYAVFRVIVGPAHKELLQFESTPYNFTPNGKLKPGGSFATAQDMGTWMAFLVPFCFAQLLSRRDVWRVVALAAMGLCTIAAVESNTRIALVGIGAGLVLVLALYAFSPAFPGLRLGVTFAAVVLGVAAIAGALLVTGNNVSHSYSGLLHPTSDPSYIAREAKWSQALDAIRTEPFGSGVGTASQAEQYAALFSATGDTEVDNGYLRIALEQGLVIMILFAAALAGMLVALVVTSFKRGEMPGAALTIGAAGTLLSYAVVMMAEDASADPRALGAWIPIGLGMAVVVDARRRLGGDAQAESTAVEVTQADSIPA